MKRWPALQSGALPGPENRRRIGHYDRAVREKARSAPSSSPPTSFTLPTDFLALSSRRGRPPSASMQPRQASCLAAAAPASRWVRPRATASSERSGLFAPMPPMPPWSLPQPTLCRSWPGRCPGWRRGPSWASAATASSSRPRVGRMPRSRLRNAAGPSPSTRAFSVYMVGTFLALAVGQLSIGRIEVEATGLFSPITLLFVLALVIVRTTRAKPPQATAAAALPYSWLSPAAPVAVVGCALSGLVASTFNALIPASMKAKSLKRTTVVMFMLMAVLGGLAFGSLRPPARPGDARPWLCVHRPCRGLPATKPAGGPAGRGPARRPPVNALTRSVSPMHMTACRLIDS